MVAGRWENREQSQDGNMGEREARTSLSVLVILAGVSLHQYIIISESPHSARIHSYCCGLGQTYQVVNTPL